MQLITAFSGEINRNFFPLASYLNAIDYHLDCLQIVLVGARDDAGTDALLGVLRDHALPTALLQRVAPNEALPPNHPAQGKEMIDGRPTVYLCRGQTCGLPITDPAVLARALNERAI
jgi:uncharacterized protein YyaL (SSP411 family)